MADVINRSNGVLHPKKQRTPLVSFDDMPGSLPSGAVPKDVDTSKVAQETITKLNDLQESQLAPNAIWRDLLAFTGTFRVFHSATTVFETWTKLSKETRRSLVKIKDSHKPRIGHGGNGISWIDVDVEFTSQHGNLPQSCMGTVSATLNESGEWQIWMLRTWLECFDGRGHPDVLDPVAGMPNGNHVAETIPDRYDAIVVGGGQSGLSTAGRLKALGLRYVVLEKGDSIGNQWASRYESLRWHTSKEYGNLPFDHTYPAEDDKMMPTKRIAAGHNAWAQKYGINAQTRTTVEHARWDDNTREWTVLVSRASGDQEELKARDLVLATGTGVATPYYPDWATPEAVAASGFKGTVLHGFEGYNSAAPWAGKRGIVVGTANTGHDIAEDMANAGMETWMLQRSPTFVFPVAWLIAAEDIHYHADQLAEIGDRENFTYPNKVTREVTNNHLWAGIKAHPEPFDALEKAGFKLDRFGDVYNNLYHRLGGHYVDIGASARIAKGEIKMKAEPVKCLTENGVLFEDGSEIGADLIVCCTGFDRNFRNYASTILGPEVADQMDDYWGTDKEGELRGLAKFAGHPNLYYFGGDVRTSRFMSRFLALQIQAEVLGTPFVPYRD